LLRVDEPLHRTVRVGDALVHLLRVDIGVEIAVDEVDRFVDVLLAVAQQVDELGRHERRKE
jgi:hypothetical protein